MNIDTLNQGNEIIRKLTRWRDIRTRLGCGGPTFFRLIFKAEKNKTMNTEFEMDVHDEGTLKAFTDFVDKQIQDLEEKFEKL